MTPSDEYKLYLNDRAAWAAFMAPRWRDMLRSASRERRHELWSIAGPELRRKLTALAEQEQFEATVREYGAGK